MAEVRVVGDRARGLTGWLPGVRRKLDSRELTHAVSQFNPDVIHAVSDPATASSSGFHRVFVTCDAPEHLATAPGAGRDMRGHLVCASTAARDSAIRAGFPADRISVVPPGVHMPSRDGSRRMARGNCFLFVGPREGPGNFDALLNAVATTPTLGDTRIVVFGGGSLSGSERKRVASLGLEGRVVAAEGDEIALAGHYASALALVHPALSDDFAMPVLEAMAWGCPVACSRTGAMLERGGDAALYFDPTDLNDIGTALVHLAADSGLRERMSAAGISRASECPWVASAVKMLAVYASVDVAAAKPADATASRS